jgi:hypothetical protein
MGKVEKELAAFVSGELEKLRDAERARAMAAYMKTTTPFYGVSSPARAPIQKALAARFAPRDHAAYVRGVLALWELPHREEKYAALYLAGAHGRFVVPESWGGGHPAVPGGPRWGRGGRGGR